jgi:uncharacterized membrane protein SpoIIM required for sporulation
MYGYILAGCIGFSIGLALASILVCRRDDEIRKATWEEISHIFPDAGDKDGE